MKGEFSRIQSILLHGDSIFATAVSECGKQQIVRVDACKAPLEDVGSPVLFFDGGDDWVDAIALSGLCLLALIRLRKTNDEGDLSYFLYKFTQRCSLIWFE